MKITNISKESTAPISSATSLDISSEQPPAPLGIPGKHEPIYKETAAQNFVVSAISSVCKKLYEEKRGKIS